jgi:GAF domain-containing protein
MALLWQTMPHHMVVMRLMRQMQKSSTQEPPGDMWEAACGTGEKAHATRLEQLEAVLAVTAEITGELDLTVLLRLIISRAVQLVGAVSGVICLWDERQHILVPQTTYGPAWHGFEEQLQQLHIRPGESLVGVAAHLLAEPLLYRQRLLGVIAISHQGTGQAFTAQERELLALLATQAAIAIDNARLHATALRHTQQLKTLSDLTRTQLTKLDPDQVAQEILQAAQLLMPGIAGRLWEWGEGNEVLHLLASIGLRHPDDDASRTFHPNTGLMGLAIATRQPVMSADVQHDPRILYKDWVAAEGFVACLILPLLYADRVCGVLTVFMRAPHCFTDEEVELLQSFAAQAAITSIMHTSTRRPSSGGARLRCWRNSPRTLTPRWNLTPFYSA